MSLESMRVPSSTSSSRETFQCDYLIKAVSGWRQHKLKFELVISKTRRAFILRVAAASSTAPTTGATETAAAVPVESWEAGVSSCTLLLVSSRKIKISYDAPPFTRRMFVVELSTAAEAEAVARSLSSIGVTTSVKPPDTDIPASQATAAYDEIPVPATPADVQRTAMANLATLPLLLAPPPPAPAAAAAIVVAAPVPTFPIPTSASDITAFAEIIAAAVDVRIRAAGGGGTTSTATALVGSPPQPLLPPLPRPTTREVSTETDSLLIGSESALAIADHLTAVLEGPAPDRDALLDALFSSGSSLRKLALAVSKSL